MSSLTRASQGTHQITAQDHVQAHSALIVVLWNKSSFSAGSLILISPFQWVIQLCTSRKAIFISPVLSGSPQSEAANNFKKPRIHGHIRVVHNHEVTTTTLHFRFLYCRLLLSFSTTHTYLLEGVCYACCPCRASPQSDFQTLETCVEGRPR